jgi:hypothetical protein
LAREAELDGALLTKFPEAPFAVVGLDEGRDGVGEFVSIAVGATVDDLFFDRAVKAFDDIVGFGLADEGEARGKAVEAALALEVVGEVLAAPSLPSFSVGLRP